MYDKKRQASSTTKAELNGVFENLDALVINQWLAAELLILNPGDTTQLWSDALNVVTAINSDHPRLNEAALKAYVMQIRRLVGGMKMAEGPVHKAIDQLPTVREGIKAADAVLSASSTTTTSTPTKPTAVAPSSRKIRIDDEHCCLLFATIVDLIKNYKLATIEVQHIDGIHNKADGLTKPLDILPIFKNTILYKRGDVMGE